MMGSQEKESQIILSQIIRKLDNCGLISNTEKWILDRKHEVKQIQVELYKLLSRKDSTAAFKILKIIQTTESVERHLIGLEKDKMYKAMQIDVIVKEIFGYLTLNDIKNCRQVCYKWNKLVEPLLRKRVYILFRRSKSQICKIEEFEETFSSSQQQMPFTCFKFQSKDDAHWSVSEITKFLDEHRTTIKDLCLEYVKLTDGNEGEERPINDSYDVTNWIIGLQLNFLKINVTRKNSSDMTVSLHSLHSVEKIHLSGCTVIFGGGEKISPKYIALIGVKMYGDRMMLQQCHLNDFINFKNAIAVVVYKRRRSLEMTLDLKECPDLNFLSLGSVKLMNFGRATCRIELFALCRISIVENTTMDIPLIRFQDQPVDLAFLPPSVITLKLISANMFCSNDKPFSLPNLRHLELHNVSDTFESDLSHFRHCPELETIDIIGENNQVEINLKCFPVRVKKLFLHKVGSIDIGFHTNLKVETLTLKGMSFQFIKEEVLSKIETKWLVLLPDDGVCAKSYHEKCKFFGQQIGSKMTIFKGKTYMRFREISNDSPMNTSSVKLNVANWLANSVD